MNTIITLKSEPPDLTPDLGPKHRGGPFALFMASFSMISAAGIILLLWREDHHPLAAFGALLFAGSAIWAIACIVEHIRHHSVLPRSHAVLTSKLGFDIHCTCRDVAATVFFVPDKLRQGEETLLCCFVENYSSRRRIAHFRIGPHPGAGIGEELSVSLELAAGQAAAYLLPLCLAHSLGEGCHDLPVTLKVDKPTGTGVLLPGMRRHLYDLWKVRFAVPFMVDANSASRSVSLMKSIGKARYLSLASVSEAEPRLDELDRLIKG